MTDEKLQDQALDPPLFSVLCPLKPKINPAPPQLPDPAFARAVVRFPAEPFP
jgi:hypothetical protein